MSTEDLQALVARSEATGRELAWLPHEHVEYWKTRYDMHKHLTTVTVATIAALAGLLQVFADPQYSIWTVVAFTALGIYIIGVRLFGREPCGV